MSDELDEEATGAGEMATVRRTGPAMRIRDVLTRVVGRAHNDAIVDVWLPENFDHRTNRTPADRAIAAIRAIESARSDLKALRGQLANDARYNARLSDEPLGQIESMLDQSLLNLHSHWSAASNQINHGTLIAAEVWAHQLPQTEDEVPEDDLATLAGLIDQLAGEVASLDGLTDAERVRAAMVIAGLRDVVVAGKSSGPMAMRAALAQWECLVRSIYAAVRPAGAEESAVRKAWSAVKCVIDTALRAQGAFEIGKDILSSLTSAGQ